MARVSFERRNFSNECKFAWINDSPLQRVWRTNNEADKPDFYIPTFSNYVSVMDWGCTGAYGVGRLVICDKSVNSD